MKMDNADKRDDDAVLTNFGKEIFPIVTGTIVLWKMKELFGEH